MTDKLKQIIQKELSKVPKEIREAIDSVDWVNISEEIGKKYLIDKNEINNFQVETLLVLVGLTEPSLYAKNIEEEVGTTPEEAKKTADEATNKIFVPIANKGSETIKKNLQNKEVDWDQGLEFVLSGGDYSVFTEKKDPSSHSDRVDVDTQIRTSKIDDLKNKFTI